MLPQLAHRFWSSNRLGSSAVHQTCSHGGYFSKVKQVYCWVVPSFRTLCEGQDLASMDVALEAEQVQDLVTSS